MSRIPLAVLTLLSGVSFLAGCGEGGAEPQEAGIDRAVFVETYVGLRRAALRTGRTPIPAEERERILEEHGVTPDELLEFIEIHGQDLDFMKSVWDTVEARLGQEPPPESLPDPEDVPTRDSLP